MTSTLDCEAAAYIHPSAQLYGRIRLEEGSSIWCNAVMRSEAAHIRIGRFTNIQDFVMIHAEPNCEVEIGDYCSITHHATIHGCKLGNNVLVGVNATIFNGAVIGDNSIVGQHAFVRDGTDVPPNSIVVGSPAKVIRTQNSWIANRVNALVYHRNALAYAKGDHRAWDGPDFERWLGATLEDLQRQFEAL
ncbi:gamma carbonic anhydrase family protein [Sphingosinicella soli]|uniref:Carbonic anhydrase/acetyltransferase-like protein (Isoleucine patch superfamily) n=1 Tax=Sphingosinicella soli TaxID=333708 RepID=A0A7W7F5B1_9SPHN|nr:gamma carbonic anhydrase family protein [Sphingosinicella soli]MBB4630514.1 carbonic anhydrase/acetyltransferase-like protein (isoleucine patch superfamily) [Sphingosinicella soli]